MTMEMAIVNLPPGVKTLSPVKYVELPLEKNEAKVNSSATLLNNYGLYTKYNNRKLYSREDKIYINSTELIKRVLDGKKVTIISKDSGIDVTSKCLLTAFVEFNQSSLSTDDTVDLIKRYSLVD